jgi:hypothetical protein
MFDPPKEYLNPDGTIPEFVSMFYFESAYTDFIISVVEDFPPITLDFIDDFDKTKKITFNFEKLEIMPSAVQTANSLPLGWIYFKSKDRIDLEENWFNKRHRQKIILYSTKIIQLLDLDIRDFEFHTNFTQVNTGMELEFEIGGKTAESINYWRDYLEKTKS